VNESSQKIESITIALFTDAEKTKLEGIETGAQVNVQANLLQNDPLEDDFVIGKDTLNSVVTSVTDILSSALSTQTSAGMATWINTHSFTAATNEIKQFHVTDTGQVFELLLRGRNFGSATPAISYIDVLDYGNPTKTVRQINSATTLANSDVGLVIILTGSCTVTIPNGLMANFECTLVTLAGATLTLALGGSVALLNNTGTTMAEKLSFTLKNTLTVNQYLTVGNL
jgi:uncharacterized protein YoxC